MSEIKTWFEEANKIVHKRGGYEFVLVKGFKITHYLKEEEYTIQDTRFNDFYKSVSETNMEIFRTQGFLKGTSIIMHERNVKRVEYYLEKIRKLMVKKAEYKKQLQRKPAFYQKRIKNCNENIHNYNDLMHFYKAKVDQFNNNKNKNNKNQDYEQNKI